jgi:hypothetical protein
MFRKICVVDAGQIDLSELAYDAQNFRDLADTSLGQDIWAFVKRPDNLVRMETATFLERAAVEPLAPGLARHFGPEIAQDRLKQMIGHMTRQVMNALGYEIDRQGLRITRESLFTSGTRYRRRDESRDRSMTITREQRQAWLEKTADSPFNRWLDRQVKTPEGGFDLAKLYQVAEKFGIDKRYEHLNPGQQRMTIGGMLRKRVPTTEYASKT